MDVVSRCYNGRGNARAEEPGWSHGPCCDTEEPHPARRIGRLYRRAQRHSSALCELAVVAQGAARHGVHLSRPHRIYREIFRGGWRASAQRLCRCRARLARAGRIEPARPQSAQGSCQRLRRLRGGPRAFHEGRGAAGLSHALFRARPLHGGDGAVQSLDQAGLLVQPHGDDRADGEGPRPPHVAQALRSTGRWPLSDRIRPARGRRTQAEVLA